MHRLPEAARIERSEWDLLDARLKQVRGVAPPAATDGLDDAELLLWLDGVRREDLAGDRLRQRILARALSCGLRTNAFELVLDRCTRLGFSDAFGTIDAVDPVNEIEHRMKHVRLLKRRGAYNDALSVLGTIASTITTRSASDDLRIRLLYSVAKSLGSHQSRSGQGQLLCSVILSHLRNIVGSTGVTWRQFVQRELRQGTNSSIRQAEQIWVKVADYRARLQLPADATKGEITGRQRRALLSRWNDVVAFEKNHGVKAGRCQFARQAAEFSLACSDEERLQALRAFERLLSVLLDDVMPDQRGVAIRALQAAQMCARTQNWGKADQYARLSLDRAATAADWPVMARALLLQASLVVATRQHSPDSWGEALYLAQRARTMMERLREPPLQLLFDHCVGEARIALAMADHTLALERIGQAIEHIARMRDDLLREDWVGAGTGSPAWLPPICRLLTPRQRAMMQTLLVADWQRLLNAQDALVELLGSAHELENYLGIAAISAARERLMRSGLAHDVANVVSRHMSILLVEGAMERDGDKVVLARNVAIAQQRIEDEIRQYVLDGRDAIEMGQVSRGNFASVSRLVAVDARQLELLRTFTPRLPPPKIVVHQDFELRCDERLFSILFFQLLLNAAQELVNAETPQIEISVFWTMSEGKEMGLIEVSDTAGRVRQLREAVEQLAREDSAVRVSGRGWGMREALHFFRSALLCAPPRVSGEEGYKATLQLWFPHGRTVSRGSRVGQRGGHAS